MEYSYDLCFAKNKQGKLQYTNNKNEIDTKRYFKNY